MRESLERVGFIGFGPMGQMMAEKMFDDCEVVAHDPNITEKQIGDAAMVDLATALDVDATILAVPAGALPKVVQDIADSPVTAEANPLLVDICSVKSFPAAVFEGLLPRHDELLLCHPLFGPNTIKDSLKGHRVIVTEQGGTKAEVLLEKWRGLGLNVIGMGADRHDREMAGVQALPFILGRLAANVGMEDSVALQTPSRLAVRKLAWLDGEHSQELFETITEFNPHAADLLAKLEAEIKNLREKQTLTANYAG